MRASNGASILQPMTAFRLFLAALLVCATPPAFAQSQSFELSDDGQWTQTDAPEPGSDAAEIAAARRDIADGRFGAARSRLNKFISQYELTGNQWLPQAFRLRGDAKTGAGSEYQALFDYERVIRDFPGSEEFVIAVEREVDIATRYSNGLKKKFFGLRIENASDLAVEIFIRAQERLPGSALAERASIQLADHYFVRRDMALAEEAYELYMLNFPNGPNSLKALKRRIYANIARFRGPRYDGGGLIDASILTQRLMDLYPAEAEKEELDEKMLERLDDSAARQMLETARWYLRTEDPPGARLTLQRLVIKHPDTPAASDAMDLMERRGWLTRDDGEDEPSVLEEME